MRNKARCSMSLEKWLCEKPKAFLTKKTTILPSKICLLVVVDDVKSLCKDMGTLVEEKLQLLRRIHRIWLIVS